MLSGLVREVCLGVGSLQDLKFGAAPDKAQALLEEEEDQKQADLSYGSSGRQPVRRFLKRNDIARLRRITG